MFKFMIKTKKVKEEKKEEVTPAATVVKFNVLSKDGAFIRTYTADDHGKEAENLAKQYATKIGGSVQ